LANVKRGGFMKRLVAMMTVLLVAAAVYGGGVGGEWHALHPGSANVLTLAVYR